MKNNLWILLVPVIAVMIYFGATVGMKLQYIFKYESLVKDTIIQKVKSECLK